MAIKLMRIKKVALGQSRGSLMALSFGFYLLAMTLAFISINVASAYNLKKELTNIAEGAINKSAQSINILAYYAGLNRFSSNKRVPIDCLAANIKFHTLLCLDIFEKSRLITRIDRIVFNDATHIRLIMSIR